MEGVLCGEFGARHCPHELIGRTCVTASRRGLLPNYFGHADLLLFLENKRDDDDDDDDDGVFRNHPGISTRR